MFVYETPPIDVFLGLTPIVQAIKDAQNEEGDDAVFCIVSLVTAGVRAVSLAEESTWEGDIRGKQMFIFAIPDPYSASTELGLIWKQDNNGTTFVCSRIEIPHLSGWRLV